VTLPILVDCDEVLADFTRAAIDVAQNELGVTMRKEDLMTWDFISPVPGLREAITRAVSDGLCRNLHSCDGAGEFLSALERRYGEENVLVLTRPWTVSPGVVSRTWLAQRAAWLEDFGVPESRLLQTGVRKGYFPGLLIDDAPHNLASREPGQRFCIARPWNRDESTLGGCPRGDYAACLRYLRTVAG
jgi:5'(3')-deoxyribonucleotidase